MDYMYNISDSNENQQSSEIKKKITLPSNILELMAFLNPCEFLGLEGLKKLVILDLLKNESFLKYTNVRRHVVDNLSDLEIEFVRFTIIFK